MIDLDRIVEDLRAGRCCAAVVAAPERPGAITRIDRALRSLGRDVLHIDLAGARSGAIVASRFVEACLPYLDISELGDLLEAVPTQGRVDIEVLAALVLLPESVAARTGRRVVMIIDGVEAIELTTGIAGLEAMRGALAARERVSYCFLGGPRVSRLFASGLALAEGVHLYGAGPALSGSAGSREPARQARANVIPPARPIPAPDPFAAALLGWAEPPPAPEPAGVADGWRSLLPEEQAVRRFLGADPEGDDGDEETRLRRWLRRRRRDR